MKVILVCNLVLSLSLAPLLSEEIIKKSPPPLSPVEFASWIDDHFTEYFQKYYLSCEAAIIRMISAAAGMTPLSEDEILDIMPRHPSKPSLGLVVQDIDGRPYHPDGSINWSNYGAHAEVVLEVLRKIFKKNNLDTAYSFQMATLDDNELRELFKKDPCCLGAIIWVAAYINKKKPPRNALGQVLGEHVEYVSPFTDTNNRFLVYDVWPWPKQPFHMWNNLNRDLFGNKLILIRAVPGGE